MKKIMNQPWWQKKKVQENLKSYKKNVILTMTAYKFVTTTTFDKEFKKLDKSIHILKVI